MNTTWIGAITIEQLAWTLIHFTWQGLLVAAIGWFLIALGRLRTPQTRYAVWLTMLVCMACLPMVTLTWIGTQTATRPAPLAAMDEVADSQRPVQQLLHELLAELQTSTPAETDGMIAELEAFTADEAAISVASVWSTWPAWVVALWCCGVCACSLRLVGAATWMWCLLSQLQPVPIVVQTTARQLCQQMGMTRLPRLAVTDAVREPLALYWFRPLILLPASWLVDVSPSVLEAVLAHELAHIRRHDLWINLGQRLVETLLFFHPCVWWVSKQIRVERELCCDAEAVRATGLPVQYAQALEMVARRRWACASPQLAVGLGGTRMALLHRVKQVLGVESSAAESQWWTIGLAGLGMTAACWMGLTMWTAPVQGEDTVTVALIEDDRPEAERDLRPAPPPRREGPPDGDRPRPPEGDRPRPPEGPRDKPRPPHGPDHEGGPRPPGPPDGHPGPRGPHHEGHDGDRPPRPIPEIVEELARAMRHLDERGPEGQREKREIMAHLMRAMNPPMERMEGRIDVHGGDHLPHPPVRGDGPGRMENAHREPPREPGEQPRMPPRMSGVEFSGPPMLEMQQDMLHAVRELRQEVERLRAEMNELREHRPPGPPPHMLGPDGHGPRGEGRPGRPPEGRDGPPPRGPRDGDAGPPRGPRDGEAGPPRGPRDAERPGPRGPREGEAGPPRGPRDGEAGPPRGPRDGEEARPRGPREEEERRPPREEEEDDQPVSAENRDA